MEISGKQIIELVKKVIKEDDHFSLNSDHYWDIPSDRLFNVYEKPEELTIGQLTEDWSELLEVLENKREPIAFHDLAHLSLLLKAIAVEEQK